MASVHRLLAAGARLPPAAALLARRPLALCGGGGLTAAAVAYALTQAAECEEAPKGSLRPLPGTAGGEGIARSQLREAIESGYLAGITVSCAARGDDGQHGSAPAVGVGVPRGGPREHTSEGLASGDLIAAASRHLPARSLCCRPSAAWPSLASCYWRGARRPRARGYVVVEGSGGVNNACYGCPSLHQFPAHAHCLLPMRTPQAFAFVSLADSLINRNQAVVSRVGRVVSSGAYQVRLRGTAHTVTQ